MFCSIVLYSYSNMTCTWHSDRVIAVGNCIAIGVISLIRNTIDCIFIGDFLHPDSIIGANTAEHSCLSCLQAEPAFGICSELFGRVVRHCVLFIGGSCTIYEQFHRIGLFCCLGCIKSFHLLGNGNCSFRYRRNIDLHLQVGSTGTAFHIEDINLMRCTSCKRLPRPCRCTKPTGV